MRLLPSPNTHSTLTRILPVLILAAALGASPTGGTMAGGEMMHPQDPPERALYVRVCAECHDLELIETLRRTESEWRGTLFEMIDQGSVASDEEYQVILDYLVRNFGAVAVNQAPADDLVTVLGISKEEGEAIVAYRTAHGDFENFDELRQVPGIDVEKIEKRKASLRFY